MDTLTIVLIVTSVVVLAAIAVVTLSTDLIRGAIGGRRTLERAQKLLVVYTDDPTEQRSRAWIREHQRSHPGIDCVPLDASSQDGDFDVYRLVQVAIDDYEPDAIVWALPAKGGRHPEEGPYAMAKRELSIPMDAIVADPIYEASD